MHHYTYNKVEFDYSFNDNKIYMCLCIYKEEKNDMYLETIVNGRNIQNKTKTKKLDIMRSFSFGSCRIGW